MFIKTSIIIVFSLFSISVYSQVGINTISPFGTLDVVAKTEEDPLILRNIKDISESPNPIDSIDNLYRDLKISKNGVVRVGLAKSQDEASILDLNNDVLISKGNSNGTEGGSLLEWKLLNNNVNSDIILSEAGSYIFSFRLYAKGDGTNTKAGIASETFYIFGINQNGAMFDAAEMLMISIDGAKKPISTYSVNLSYTSSSPGEKVHFKMSKNEEPDKLGLILRGNPGSHANKTSMIFWRID